MAEANLKGRSHPAFIRWSISNATKPRLTAIIVLGVLLTILGLALDVLLVLSRLNHFLRILCITLWWPGMVILVAASRYGVCIFLHLRNVRQVRPWELVNDDVGGKLDDVNTLRSDAYVRRHSRKDTASSTLTTLSSRGPDPLRKPSLQTFGPKNEADAESSTKPHVSTSLYGKIFGDDVSIQNRSLQRMQDRAVLISVVWGGVAASVLAVASLFLPSGNIL